MTNCIVIGRFGNKENTQALVEAIRAKGKTCYDFTEKPAAPKNPTTTGEEQIIPNLKNLFILFPYPLIPA